MQNLDDKMDELFQKAADNYPLKINTGNFDELLPFIGSETATTSVKPSFTKGKRRTALLLLAFLFMGLTIGTTYLITSSRNNKANETKATLQEKSIAPFKINTVPKVNIKENDLIVAKETTENTFSSIATIFQKNKLTSNTNGSSFMNILSPVASSDADLKQQNDNSGNVTPVEENVQNNIINQRQTPNKTGVTEDETALIDKVNKKTDTTTNEIKVTVKKDNENKRRDRPDFYYGIAAGAEYNEVKNQSMTKLGLNAGIVLGLQISSTTSIETGVQVSQKKYYSAGKYFKPKAGSMPANMLIESLQSTSTIIEIPISLKYNFSKKKNTLYGKAGVSTYILTKESNKYQAVVSGQQQEINTTYNNNHNYFASDLRISAGYQHALGKRLNIRIEPYVQIPLKGIGVGNMPVTTTGLQFVLIQN